MGAKEMIDRRWIIGSLVVGPLFLLSAWLLATDRLDDYCYDTFLDYRCDYLMLGGSNSVRWQDEDGGYTIFWTESVIRPSQNQVPPLPVEEELPVDFRLRLINTPQEVLDQLPEEVRQDCHNLITAARESLFEQYVESP